MPALVSAPVKVLVIGSGAREHALARTLSRDPAVSSLACAPGNPGTEALGTNHAIAVTDGPSVAGLARDLAADLVVIGPEAPLVAGVADAVRAAGVACFGPSAAAARIEGSKAFAKDVMASADVPTGASFACLNQQEVALALDTLGPPYVVKDDGLAGGKGVVVTDDRAAAEAHAATCQRVVIEEHLGGPEASLLALTDGETVVPLPPVRDYKRARDGDRGPNTGGMGAYTPLPCASADLTGEVGRTIMEPTVAELSRRGTPYAGLLYAGLALTDGGPRVLEFNARFGDPEAQVVLAGLRTPLAGLLHAAATGALATAEPPRWDSGGAVTVVVAAEGYPASPIEGDAVEGIGEAEAVTGTYVLHAGTAHDARGRLVTSGGRVLSVTGTGTSVEEARPRAYEAAGRIRIRGAHYRGDIAAAV